MSSASDFVLMVCTLDILPFPEMDIVFPPLFAIINDASVNIPIQTHLWTCEGIYSEGLLGWWVCAHFLSTKPFHLNLDQWMSKCWFAFWDRLEFPPTTCLSFKIRLTGIFLEGKIWPYFFLLHQLISSSINLLQSSATFLNLGIKLMGLCIKLCKIFILAL